jgi:2-oxoisovalerate dehydrogenase E2 component (dihydrolipoyl transacylase)
MMNRTLFKLPDLGEGLTEATLQTWHVSIGDHLKKDDLICTVETDKSLVDIPAMDECVVTKLCFKEKDRIQVNQTLCELHYTNSQSIVGILKENSQTPTTETEPQTTLKIHPAALEMAKKHQLSDSLLQSLAPNGSLIRPADIERHLQNSQNNAMSHIASSSLNRSTSTIIDHCAISGHHQITAVLISAVKHSLQKHSSLNMTSISLAVDDDDRTHLISSKFSEDITECQNQLFEIKSAVGSRKIPQSWLKKADFLISNFGSIAGRYGIPMLPPETKVALGIGRSFIENDQMVIPLTLVFDHSIYTGGQMTRLLKTLMESITRQSSSLALIG